MALLKLQTALENALGELSLEEGVEEGDCAGSQSSTTQPMERRADEGEEMIAAGGKGSNAVWNTRMPSVGYCSTASTTPLASATSAIASALESRSEELTPSLQERPRGELLNAPGQHGLLPGGLGHFRLGTSCLQSAKGPLEALPMEQRIEEAEAAEAKLEAALVDLVGLKNNQDNVASDALLLAQASLQARGVPGASSSSAQQTSPE
eukprot:CAMPEP_0181403002 /NCGR_PEP_ID=MMETSP1110-20121109/3470_1 /TAXON_ID=174948 /ORGANISM="Symbiodinium sp., Strain CCMP421" /LENGTH=207 /DNA_ID=CAMNT_0023525247 /DNA_START=44 /DNA_END=667 /DNA_ORIENTATION=-